MNLQTQINVVLFLLIKRMVAARGRDIFAQIDSV